MPETTPARTVEMALDEVIRRLSRHPAVDGILVMGSTAGDAMRPESDYDLLVVLAGTDAPLFLIVTTIDHRLGEIYFTPATEIDAILASGDLATLARDHLRLGGTLLAWLHHGQIVFDRSQRLRRAQERLASGSWHTPAGVAGHYAAWFSINYNLRQTRRMLAADDPVYHTAVDLRLLYTLFDLWTAYFRVRDLAPQGEKKEIRYLAAHDPAYLELFRRGLAEPDRWRKFELYVQLARQTLAPVSDLWPEDATAVQLRAEVEPTPPAVANALRFWNELLGA